MPVTVEVPLRIVVDPQALDTHLDEIEDAVTVATGRALANAKAVIEETRGGYPVHRTYEPVLEWTGEALADVPAEIRERCEQVIRDALAQVVADTFPVRPAPAQGDSDSFVQRMTSNVFERVDRSRLWERAGLYVLPSYNDGDDSAVAVRPGSTRDAAPMRSQWLVVTNTQQLVEAATAIEADYASTGYSEAQLGMISGGALAGWQGWVIVVWRRPEKTWIIPPTRLPSPRIIGVDTSGDNANVTLGSETSLPPRGSYRLRTVGPGRTREERLEVARNAYGDWLRGQIEQAVRGVASHVTREIETAAHVEAMLELTLQRAAENMPEAPCYLLLTFSGRFFLFPHGQDVQGLDTELFPFAVRGDEPEPTGGGGEGSGGGTSGGSGREGGTGSGSGSGQGGGEGGLSIMPERGDGSGGAGSIFPAPSQSGGETLTCESFNGELSLSELGDAGAGLSRLIDEIARDLQMSPCPHAARFCINAAIVIESRTALIADHSLSSYSFTQARRSAGGGPSLRFIPTPSPAILLLRHLATVVPKITQLARLVQSVYSEPAVFSRMGGPWNHSSASWNLHFLMDFTPTIAESVGRLFVRGCQVLLLQLLRASREEIDRRIASLPTYLPVLERMIASVVMSVEDLDILHDRLEEEMDDSTLHAAGRAVFGTWQEARNSLADLLAGRDPFASAPVDRGSIVRLNGRAAAIQDRNGRIWTLEQLREAISMRRGTAIGIDPLVSQIIDDDEVLDRFRREPSRIGPEMTALLNEMRDRNQEITGEVRDSSEQAFQYGRIHEQLDQRTIPGTSYVLSGIHLQVHEQIGEFFRGDAMYAEGVDRLFSAELGKDALFTFFEITGLTLLAIVCAPAAMIVGGGLAAYRYTEALERESLFRSLIDPNEIITRSEVEMDLFFGQLEIVLQFIPEVGTILRGTTRAAGVLARKGLAGGARVLARQGRMALRAELRAIARRLQEATLEHLVRQIVEDQIEDQILDTLIFQPIANAIQAEYGTPGPGAGGTGSALINLDAGR